MNQKQTKLLYELLSQPTAPFREEHVARVVIQYLEKEGVPYFRDPVGNIVIGVGSRRDYIQALKQKTPEPLRLFMAHMDHPGFHGVRWLSPRRLSVKWYGGSPVKYVSGSKVWLADDESRQISGKLVCPKLVKGKWAIATAEVVLQKGYEKGKRPPARKLFGSFKFRSPVWQQGKRLYTNAADDLAGVFAILDTAARLWRDKKSNRSSFVGLLTRAEEVGFVGAVGHFNLGWLDMRKRSVLCISLEASRTLPGAEIGKGPIVRLGDRRTVFQADGLKLLKDVAERVLPKKHQVRIMDGGSCEATAATVFGLPAIGISLPLGNYHNQGFEGGADCPAPGGPAPEFVSPDDLTGELRLCWELMKPGLKWLDPWEKQRNHLQKNLRRYSRFLG